MRNNFETKPGSLEEAIAGITIKDEHKYQQLFKKELEKAGKGIGAMTPAEKKAFFNKIDKMYKGKNEDLDSKDVPKVKDVAKQLKKAVQAHGQQAKDLEKAIKTEGTWAIPDTPQKKMKLKKLLQSPIKLGKEGDDASDKLYGLVGDDSLFDDLYVAGKKNPNGDARPLVRKHMKRLGIKEEVEESVEYVEYMAKNSGQAGTIANMFKGKTGGGEIHKSGSEVRIDAAKNIEAIHKQVMAKFPDTNVMTAEAYLDEMFGNKVVDPTTAAALRLYLKGKAGGAPFPPVVEGMMSKIDQMEKEGKSAAEIAKALKLDVKTVKGILGETHMGQTAKANAQQKNAKGEKEIIKSITETIVDMWKEAAEKKEKKKDIAPDADNIDEKETEEEEKKPEKESSDKLKADVAKKDDEIAILKQKIEQEKNKAIQQDTSKMVNPETGEPLLQVGVAYKHLRDKMKKEAVDKKEQIKNKKTTDTDKSASKVDVNPEIEYDK